MSDSDGGCCRCCCSFIFTLGLTALFMWLSLRTSNPKCSVENFYLPSLDTTLKNPNDATLNLTLKLENTNKDKGIKYDAVKVTVSDSQNRNHVVANVSVPEFYQGHEKKAKKIGTGIANSTVASQVASINGKRVFWVDLSTSVKFKIMFWYTKRHKIRVGANVTVNATGVKDERKGIKLKSMAPRMGSFCVVMGSLLNFLVFSLLNF
ncbi:hypothetical protein ES319_A01G075900v1 [Gossypium barbadense]|uniref:Late embryogenesis abundant protein LEA-2 subgroup domain-containing protein n=2 Tax=Gossypium TaxID=3633 RepID=A0A2P5WYX1_GOSBA|nr:hypothetical protein ES319_A01G075900v1 [Gossypium barbadense]PPR96283.1 hypothetical protein GOBAR_AA24390 [Gossypium barbadense]TYH30294.1 hypothetical protein ES288_A01G083200v1 [Gossypium darwinii]